MTKWSTLTGGKTSTAEKSEWTLVTFMTLALAVIGIVAVVGLVVMRSKKAPAPVTIEPALTVVQPKVAEVPEPDPIVETKSVNIVLPVKDAWDELSDETYTFVDFQKAFQQGRQGPISDRKSQKDLGSLDSLRADIQASGKTVANYMDTYGIQVSDALLEALQQETSRETSRSILSDFYDQETMILAREALQDIPMKVSESLVVPVLREILSARTEAAASEITLPDMTPEQRYALTFWSSKDGPAKSLAVSILSRL